ncbi:Histone H2A, partial [Operophtera brumata]
LTSPSHVLSSIRLLVSCMLVVAAPACRRRGDAWFSLPPPPMYRVVFLKLLEVVGDLFGGVEALRAARARIPRKGNFVPRIGSGAPIFLAAVLQYLAAEILELASNAARFTNKTRITPRHFLLAVKYDEDLNRMLSAVTTSGGLLQSFNPHLLPKNTMKNPASQEYAYKTSHKLPRSKFY